MKNWFTFVLEKAAYDGVRTGKLGPFGVRVVWVPGEPGRAKRVLLPAKKLRIAGAGRSSALLDRGRPDFLLASRALLPSKISRYRAPHFYPHLTSLS